MKFEISETNIGKKCLMTDEYGYRIDVTLKDESFSWRCKNKTCKARLRTDSSISTCVQIRPDHSHDRVPLY